MNGDTGKLYATSPEPIMVAPPPSSNTTNSTNTSNVPDYTAMNGAVPNSNTSNSVTQGGADPDLARNQMSPTNGSNGSAGANMPLEQLKQLLSTQLEYYFSR